MEKSIAEMDKAITESELQVILLLGLEMRSKHHDWRGGQAIFNALYELHSKVANIIRGTKIDPFYDNNKISDCIKFITQTNNERQNYENQI